MHIRGARVGHSVDVQPLGPEPAVQLICLGQKGKQENRDQAVRCEKKNLNKSARSSWLLDGEVSDVVQNITVANSNSLRYVAKLMFK